jgi:hypothetical protein
VEKLNQGVILPQKIFWGGVKKLLSRWRHQWVGRVTGTTPIFLFGLMQWQFDQRSHFLFMFTKFAIKNILFYLCEKLQASPKSSNVYYSYTKRQQPA